MLKKLKFSLEQYSRILLITNIMLVIFLIAFSIHMKAELKAQETSIQNRYDMLTQSISTLEDQLVKYGDQDMTLEVRVTQLESSVLWNNNYNIETDKVAHQMEVDAFKVSSTVRQLESIQSVKLYQSSVNNGTKEVISIYTIDGDTYEPIERYAFLVDKTLTITDKIDRIAEELSVNVFGLPVTVDRIQEIDGMKIAEIMLGEDDRYGDALTWKYQYFQGSLGSAMTMTTLQESFLQRAYQGEWIDGIRIFYEDGSVYSTDHIETFGTLIKR